MDRDAGLSIDEAAATLGVNPSTVRRRIREGKLHAQKVWRPQGYALRVLLDDEQLAGSSYVHLGADGCEQVGTADAEQLGPASSDRLPAPPDRAEAMASYNAALLAPLVAELSRTRGQLVEQAEEIGHLRAQLEDARAQLALSAPTNAPQSHEDARETASPGGAVQESTPAPSGPWWRRLWDGLLSTPG
jgi:excisionase family DNA binding protein